VRGRHHEITRLEAFSDAVFAFALTLLVVSLEVPRSYPELMLLVRSFIPFACCFALLVWIWHEHSMFFSRYSLRDGPTTLRAAFPRSRRDAMAWDVSAERGRADAPSPTP